VWRLQKERGGRDAGRRPESAPPARKAAPDARSPPRRRRKTTESWAKLPRGPLDVNQASFEQFRALGLSVSQCARLIATRDIRGGFKSLDELGEIEGLPPSAVRDLRERLGVDGGEAG